MRKRMKPKRKELMEFVLKMAGLQDWSQVPEHITIRDFTQSTLNKHGWTDIRWGVLERDAFGPVVLGMDAKDPKGKLHHFFYFFNA